MIDPINNTINTPITTSNEVGMLLPQLVVTEGVVVDKPFEVCWVVRLSVTTTVEKWLAVEEILETNIVVVNTVVAKPIILSVVVTLLVSITIDGVAVTKESTAVLLDSSDVVNATVAVVKIDGAVYDVVGETVVKYIYFLIS